MTSDKVNDTPVFIKVTRIELNELNSYGMCQKLYQDLSKIKGDEFTIDFSREWFSDILSKNSNPEVITVAYCMFKNLPLFLSNKIDSIEYNFSSELAIFNKLLKEKKIETIINHFGIPTKFILPDTKIDYCSIFFWLDYVRTIKDNSYDIVRAEGFKDDGAYFLALMKFGRQDLSRLNNDWPFIQTRLPKTIAQDRAFLVNKFDCIEEDGPIIESRITSLNYHFAKSKFWESLIKYKPGAGKKLVNWLYKARDSYIYDKTKSEMFHAKYYQTVDEIDELPDPDPTQETPDDLILKFLAIIAPGKDTTAIKDKILNSEKVTKKELRLLCDIGDNRTYKNKVAKALKNNPSFKFLEKYFK